METLDPHGWMLSLISVLVVFSALVLLYLIYSLIGKLSTRAMARPTPLVPPITTAVRISFIGFPFRWVPAWK